MRMLLLALLLAPAAGTQTLLKVRPQPAVNSTTIELPLEKYVAAVLAGEGSVLRSDEALKALAVAARTFGVYGRGRHAQEGYDLCGTTHCQRVDLAGVTPRMERAAAAARLKSDAPRIGSCSVRSFPMWIRIQIAAMVYLMVQAIMFGAGMVLVLATPLNAMAMQLIPWVVGVTALLSLPISWLIAPRLRARYWREKGIKSDFISGPV